MRTNVPVFSVRAEMVVFAKSFFTHLSEKPVETALIKQSENEHNMIVVAAPSKNWKKSLHKKNKGATENGYICY